MAASLDGRERLGAQHVAAEVKEKLAERLAQFIERDIAAGGFRVGDKLGTEEALSVQYSVSRTVLREALALVERSGLLHARRGKGGGLIVGEVTAETIAANLQRYLDFISQNYEETLDLRRTIEGLTSRLAAERLDDEQLLIFRELLQAHASATSPEELVTVTVQMVRQAEVAARNPMLQVVSLLVGRQTLHHLAASGAIQRSLFERTPEAIDDANTRAALIRAIIAGEVGHGWQHVCRLMEIFRALISGPKWERPSEAADSDAVLSLMGVGKEAGLAHHIAATIKARIVEKQLGEGDSLGSESSLIAELGVGRGVFRSAVRLLEQLSVVKMVSGKNGGLRVLTPDPRSIIARSVTQLRSLGVAWGDIEEVTGVLAPLAIERAMRTIDAPRTIELLETFDALTQVQGASLRDLAAVYHGALAKISSHASPSLSFMFSLMQALISLCEGSELENVRISGVNAQVFAALRAAVEAGEIELARRRLIALPKAGFRFVVRTKSVRLQGEPDAPA
jgi:DNA-binding FadR family transcriptional regulator